MTNYLDSVRDIPGIEPDPDFSTEALVFGDADPAWHEPLRKMAEGIARDVRKFRTLQHCFELHTYNSKDRSRPRRQRSAARDSARAVRIHGEVTANWVHRGLMQLVDVGILPNYSGGVTREQAEAMAMAYVESLVVEGWDYETMALHGIRPR